MTGARRSVILRAAGSGAGRVGAPVIELTWGGRRMSQLHRWAGTSHDDEPRCASKDDQCHGVAARLGGWRGGVSGLVAGPIQSIELSVF